LEIKKAPLIDEFSTIKHKNIYYVGDLSLLKSRKVSIVGTRKPISYTKEMVFRLSNSLSKVGVSVVSGGAMGVDIIALDASLPNCISVMPCSLDLIYPKVNENKIKKIYENALAISEYEATFRATKWSFVQRNRLVTLLGEVLIIAEADLNSGSMRSFEWAKKYNRDVYVLAHRLGQSEGTNYLLKNNLAKAIYDIDEFIDSLNFEKIESKKESLEDDDIIKFCLKNSNYEDAIAKFGDKIFEYELYGKIAIENNFIRVL